MEHAANGGMRDKNRPVEYHGLIMPCCQVLWCMCCSVVCTGGKR